MGTDFLATVNDPGRAVHCALALAASLHSLGSDVRVGVHAGEVELLPDDIGGIAVHIGARVAAELGVGEVVVSSTVEHLVVSSGIRFTSKGQHRLSSTTSREVQECGMYSRPFAFMPICLADSAVGTLLERQCAVLVPRLYAPKDGYFEPLAGPAWATNWTRV